MKKSLLTLIMALVMALACATSAFAEDLGSRVRAWIIIGYKSDTEGAGLYFYMTGRGAFHLR